MGIARARLQQQRQQPETEPPIALYCAVRFDLRGGVFELIDEPGGNFPSENLELHGSTDIIRNPLARSPA